MHASATARAAAPAPHPVFPDDASTAAMKHPFSACTHRSLVLSDALSATSCTHTHTHTHGQGDMDAFEQRCQSLVRRKEYESIHCILEAGPDCTPSSRTCSVSGPARCNTSPKLDAVDIRTV